MEDPKKLEEQFWNMVKKGSEMPPQTADNMLIAYAYFKQATDGNNDNQRPQTSSNVIQTFKHDAWKRLQGMPQEEAKKKYIETIQKLMKESGKSK